MISHIHRFSVFMWTGENDSHTLRVDAYFLKKRGKDLRFQKYPDTCMWTGPYFHEMLR